MAYVSKTTIVRREIQASASHHSSLAIGAGIGGSSSGSPSPADSPTRSAAGAASATTCDGVLSLGEFRGYSRAAVVIESPEAADVSTTTVWTAEADGSILVRKGHTGTPIPGQVISPPNSSYITVLLQCGTDVWAGFADGHLRIFDTKTRLMTFEKKRHAGAITVLERLPGDLVASGAEDFQILLWEIPQRKVVSQFVGHTNHIRGIVADANGHVYSVSVDGVVKKWNLAYRAEVVGNGYPFRAHRNGEVKSLAILDGFLFTAGKTGVSLWELHSAEHTHTFVTSKAVVAIAPSEATVTLWIATADGVISIYDLFNFQLVGKLQAHINSVVTVLQAISRSVANRLFTLTEAGVLDVISSDSDAFVEGFQIITDEYKTLHARLAEQRTKAVQNAEALLQKRSELRSLLRYYAEHRKFATSGLSHQRDDYEMVRHLQLARHKVQIQRNTSKRVIAAKNTQQANELRLRHVYLVKWLVATHVKAMTGHRGKITAYLTHLTGRTLEATYLRTVAHGLNRRLASKRQAKFSQVMQQVVYRARRSTAFNLWRSWIVYRRFQRKRPLIVSIMQRFATKDLALVTWHGLETGAREVHRRRAVVTFADVLFQATQRSLQRKGYEALTQRCVLRRKQRRMQSLSDLMMRSVNEAQRRNFFGRWLAASQEHEKIKLDAANAALTQQASDIRAIIDDPKWMTDAELDAAFAEVEAAMNVMVDDITIMKVDTADLLAEKAALDSRAAPRSVESEKPPVAASEPVAETKPVEPATAETKPAETAGEPAPAETSATTPAPAAEPETAPAPTPAEKPEEPKAPVLVYGGLVHEAVCSIRANGGFLAAVDGPLVSKLSLFKAASKGAVSVDDFSKFVSQAESTFVVVPKAAAPSAAPAAEASPAATTEGGAAAPASESPAPAAPAAPLAPEAQFQQDLDNISTDAAAKQRIGTAAQALREALFAWDTLVAKNKFAPDSVHLAKEVSDSFVAKSAWFGRVLQADSNVKLVAAKAAIAAAKAEEEARIAAEAKKSARSGSKSAPKPAAKVARSAVAAGGSTSPRGRSASPAGPASRTASPAKPAPKPAPRAASPPKAAPKATPAKRAASPPKAAPAAKRAASPPKRAPSPKAAAPAAKRAPAARTASPAKPAAKRAASPPATATGRKTAAPATAARR